MAEPLYGFMNLKELFYQKLSDTNTSTVNAAIADSVAEHNRQMDALISLFATTTTDYQVRFKTARASRLQPLDEDGRARPIIPVGAYDVAFPIKDAGTAWGANYKTRAKMTVQDANDITSAMLTADRRWIRDQILGGLFSDNDWVYQDPEHGTLAIKGLANADEVTYQIMTGGDIGATDDHYLAQASAIDDANDPFPVLYEEIAEHPENGDGDVVALVPTNLKQAVTNLAAYVPNNDPNLRYGSGVTTLNGMPSARVPGEIIGYHQSGVWLCEWRSMPSSYIAGVGTGGSRPLAMRQEPETMLQGFQQVANRDDHPFYESQWLRIAGFGAWNRVGAVVYQIGNASYTVPTGYEQPLG